MSGDDRLESEELSWRPNWLLSVVWLIFVCFPVASLWYSSEPTQREKVAATIVIAVFVVVYALGFRHTIRYAFSGESSDFGPLAWGYLTTLIVLNVLAMVIGGWGPLGLVPYVVSFAVFNLRWSAVIVAVATGTMAVVVAPILGDVYGELWVLTPVTVSVAVGTILIRLVEAREQERALMRTELVVSDERNRVARDVHDVLGHSLTAVVIKAELTERLLSGLEPATDADRAVLERCEEELVELQAISRRALTEIRSTVGGLRNPTLADEVAVARTVLADAGVSLVVTGDPTAVPERLRSTLAWVVREAVTNVVRHARAEQCNVAFAVSGQTLLRIGDDGVGAGDDPEGNGLQGVRERLAAVGATLAVGSSDDGGMQIEVKV